MIIDDTISISKYNPLAGKSDIKLQKKLDHSRKGLINNQNADKDFEKRLDFKDVEFPIKIRHIHKIEKKSSICISVFG